MSERTSAQVEVLAALWRAAEHLAQTNIWPDLDEDDDVRAALPDVPELLEGLRQTLPQDALWACGALARQADGSLRLAPRLRWGNGPFVALRSSASAAPYDLLTNSGLALGDETTAEAVLEDHRYVPMLAASGRCLLAVERIEDVLVARRLGLPAIPWVGLVAENLSCLRDLQHLTGGCRPILAGQLTDQGTGAGDLEPAASNATCGSEGSAPQEMIEFSSASAIGPESLHAEARSPRSRIALPESERARLAESTEVSAGAPAPIELILAAWSFWRREAIPIEQLRPMTEVLAQAQEFLGADLSGIAVWIPERRECQRIEFCWRLQDREAVRGAIIDSVANSSYAILPEASRPIGPRQGPQDYSEARAALSLALRVHGKGSPEVRRALHEYMACYEREYGERLMREAGSADAVRHVLWTLFGEQSRLLAATAPSLQAELAGAFYETRVDESQSLLINTQGRFFLQLTDRLLKSGRGLIR